MSRSAAATPAGRQRALPRQATPRHHRRVSGPAPSRRDAAALAAPGAVALPRAPRPHGRPPLRVVAGGAAIATRVAGVALDASSSRLMDRLVRSRLWIGIIAFGLIGIVAMQVSMLKLNSGIGRAVEASSTLERTNSGLRADVSRLSNGERIQSMASARGFVMPAPADVTYLRSSSVRADAAQAARRMIAPDRALAGPAGAPVPAPVTTPATALGAAATTTTIAPGTTTPGTATPATTTPPTATPTPPAATTAPAAPVQQPVAPVTAPATTAVPQTTASAAGGIAPPPSP